MLDLLLDPLLLGLAHQQRIDLLVYHPSLVLQILLQLQLLQLALVGFEYLLSVLDLGHYQGPLLFLVLLRGARVVVYTF